jgi:hypothetical protein
MWDDPLLDEMIGRWAKAENVEPAKVPQSWEEPLVLPDTTFQLLADDWILPLANGDTQVDDIVIIGRKPRPFDWSWDDSRDSGSEPPPPDLTQDPDCNTTKEVSFRDGSEVPDGAKYYMPEVEDGGRITRAIDHLQSFPDAISKYWEFYQMYTNPNHPHFIDFKDWGTPNGPPGSVSGGTMRYYSDVVGGWVETSAFEPFGNWAYGFIGIMGGILQEELLYMAGAAQTGSSLGDRFLGRDDPQDRPHVMKGIQDGLTEAARRYLGIGAPVATVQIGSCGTGSTGSGSI